MTGNLSTTQSVKQSTRQLMSVASDKMKLASSAVARGDTRTLLRVTMPAIVRPDPVSPLDPLELDVAVIKSTTPQFHVVPKEKHVRTLKDIVLSGTKDHVREVIREVLQRLKTATDWLTALKCLMVLHRLMRECGTTFLNALAQQSNALAANSKGRGLLNMGNFLDTTNIDGRFDFSEWVRGYGRYLDEQLEVYKELNFYPEMETGGDSSRMRTLSGDQLLKQLPTLQRLQQRLTDCKPSGVAAHDPVVQAALLAVLKESFRVYKAVSEGIINLADRFFEMEYLDAQKGLEIYKESVVDNARLQEYYREIEQIEELKRAVQFPRLENLPPDFLHQMENYVREAPRPIEEAAAASKKKSPPLRRGTKATGARPQARFESVSSATSDPGMISTFSKVIEQEPKPAANEPNLLDLEELSVTDPSPATTGPSSAIANGFGGSSHVSPAGDAADPFSAPGPAAFTPPGGSETGFGSDIDSLATLPQGTISQQGPGTFSQQQAPPVQSAGGDSNPFGPSSAFVASPALTTTSNGLAAAGSGRPNSAYRPAMPGTAVSSEQFPSGLPQAQAAASAPQRGGAPMTAQQAPQIPGYGGFGGQPANFSMRPDAFAGRPDTFGSQPASFGSQPAGFGTTLAPHQVGNSGLGGAQDGFATLAQATPQGFGGHPPAMPGAPYQGGGGFHLGAGAESQSALTPGRAPHQNGVARPPAGADLRLGGFGRPPSQTPASRSPAPAVAAGLIRPTNVNLAKEAALHDPFASLASLRPSATPKHSPPLKNLGSPSPGSTAGQTSGSPSPALQAPLSQPPFGQHGGNGSQGFGSNAFGGSTTFGATSTAQFQKPTPQSVPAPQQQPAATGYEPSSFGAEASGSLI